MNFSAFPSCCGARVVVGFTEIDEKARNRFIEMVHDERAKATSNKMLFVILNDSQCQTSPKLLETLAALGFVFCGRSNNGLHNSWINVFVQARLNGRSYKAPPFSYPGINRADWILEADAVPELAKIPYEKPVVVNPFDSTFDKMPDYRFDVASLAA